MPLTLIGHSAGGGFSLRVAATPIMQDLFVRTVLLAPYLGYDAPTNRPHSGGWANADIPRFLGLAALRKLGIDCCVALPVLAFAVPANSEKILTSTYSDRLMRNFAHARLSPRSAAVTQPMTIFGGADDEMMISDKYAETVQARQTVGRRQADRRRQPHGHRHQPEGGRSSPRTWQRAEQGRVMIDSRRRPRRWPTSTTSSSA